MRRRRTRRWRAEPGCRWAAPSRRAGAPGAGPGSGGCAGTLAGRGPGDGDGAGSLPDAGSRPAFCSARPQAAGAGGEAPGDSTPGLRRRAGGAGNGGAGRAAGQSARPARASSSWCDCGLDTSLTRMAVPTVIFMLGIAASPCPVSHGRVPVLRSAIAQAALIGQAARMSPSWASEDHRAPGRRVPGQRGREGGQGTGTQLGDQPGLCHGPEPGAPEVGGAQHMGGQCDVSRVAGPLTAGGAGRPPARCGARRSPLPGPQPPCGKKVITDRGRPYALVRPLPLSRRK